MKVVLLAGGYGTRIRDVDENIPKPMIPIGRFPIIWHIMKYYSFYGHNEFILCLGYKGNVIRNFFANYHLYTQDITLDLKNNSKFIFHSKNNEEDWKVTLVDTGIGTMTGGRLSKIEKYIDEENFFINYGDGVGDINLDKLLQFHLNHKKILTVTGVRPPGRFGEIRTKDGNTSVKEFNEKPQSESGRISGGFFVANKKIFEFLSNETTLIFEKEPINNLVKSNELEMFKHDGFWQPMDTGREYRILNELYENKNAPWIKW